MVISTTSTGQIVVEESVRLSKHLGGFLSSCHIIYRLVDSVVVDINGTVVPSWVSNVELGTLRQEKEPECTHEENCTCWGPYEPRDASMLAGSTCEKCPNPLRPLEDEEGAVQWTERCKACNTVMKRWIRRKKLEERIMIPTKYLEGHVFVAFITLTIPNVEDRQGREDLPEEVRKLKKRVASFRRRDCFDGRVLGGIDVFENTVRPNGDWNIHHHGIWIMSDYWNQKEFEEVWGFRTRIEMVRKPHAVMQYLLAYARKQPIEGVRCLETFGVSRGRAYSAIEGYVRHQKDSTNAGVAPAKSQKRIRRMKWYDRVFREHCATRYEEE